MSRLKIQVHSRRHSSNSAILLSTSGSKRWISMVMADDENSDFVGNARGTESVTATCLFRSYLAFRLQTFLETRRGRCLLKLRDALTNSANSGSLRAAAKSWSCDNCSLENVELTAVPTARASARDALFNVREVVWAAQAE